MHLSPTAAIGAGALLVAVGVVVGWGAGRAYQRAVDSWRALRNHMALTRTMWRRARYTTGDAASTVLLAVLVLAAAGLTAWMLL
jgi:hypothetical protein